MTVLYVILSQSEVCVGVLDFTYGSTKIGELGKNGALRKSEGLTK